MSESFLVELRHSSVYVLLDPNTGHPRYVGKAERSLEKRFKNHLFSHNKTPVAEWIRDLLASGNQPVMMELEGGLTVREVREKEAFWIRYFRFMGADLLNRMHNNWPFGIKRRTRWDVLAGAK